MNGTTDVSKTAKQAPSYADFRRARHATSKVTAQWRAPGRDPAIETQWDTDAELLELRCEELHRKSELENALYAHAYNSTPPGSVKADAT